MVKCASDALTQRIRQPRVGLLRLGQLWDILRERSGSGNRTWVVVARFEPQGNDGNTQLQACGDPDLSISRICTLISMTLSLRATAGIADQGSRTLSADARLGLPRQSDQKQLRRRERFHAWGRNERHSGLLKNMRRMRLFMVPLLDSGVCILY